MNRRSFVKTAMGAAVAGTAVASGLSLAAGLAIPRAPAGPLTAYWGTHKVAGPAPRGMPYIPIAFDEAEGAFVGKTTITAPDGSTINVLEWYKYCGHAGAPGLRLDEDQDNVLRYLKKDDYGTITPWFNDYLDQPVRPEHFPAHGFGAAFRWRSEGQSGANIISGSIIRAEPSRVKLIQDTVSPAKPLADEAEFNWLKENIFANVNGVMYIGVSTYCTHFCCTPAYREAEKLSRPRNSWDNIFCTCHNSNYDFSQPVRYTFAPEIATEAGGFDPLLTRGGSGGGH